MSDVLQNPFTKVLLIPCILTIFAAIFEAISQKNRGRIRSKKPDKGTRHEKRFRVWISNQQNKVLDPFLWSIDEICCVGENRQHIEDIEPLFRLNIVELSRVGAELLFSGFAISFSSLLEGKSTTIATTVLIAQIGFLLGALSSFNGIENSDPSEHKRKRQFAALALACGFIAMVLGFATTLTTSIPQRGT